MGCIPPRTPFEADFLSYTDDSGKRSICFILGGAPDLCLREVRCDKLRCGVLSVVVCGSCCRVVVCVESQKLGSKKGVNAAVNTRTARSSNQCLEGTYVDAQSRPRGAIIFSGRFANTEQRRFYGNIGTFFFRRRETESAEKTVSSPPLCELGAPSG